MKYPYERFLRFLVSRKVDPTRTLERYGLPRPGDLWIAGCRTNLRQTGPHALISYLATDSQDLPLRDGILEWADTEQIGPLWRMQPEFGATECPALDLAHQLFVNHYSRAICGMLLLSRVSDAEIIKLLAEQFDLTTDAGVLAIYRTIFWDVTLVGRTGWEKLLQILRSEEERNFIAFGLNAPNIAGIRDLLDMDMPTVDARAILNQIIAKAYSRFKEAMEGPNPEANNALHWAELTLKAIGTTKTSGVGADANAAQTSSERFKGMFSVVPTKSAHPTLADLAGEVAKAKKIDQAK